jgi:hypothetical protein
VILVVASLVLLLLGVLAYRRHLAPSGAPGLFLLRLVVLLLLGAILAGVTIKKSWTVRPRHLAVLVDRSASMSATGADTLVDRYLARLILPARLRRDAWSFADSCRKGTAAPGSDRTRIAAALKQVARTRPAAVILASDGQDNGEGSAVHAAQTLGVPVYAVGFGAAPARNLAVTRFFLPAVVHVGDTARVLVRVVGTGLDRERVRVRLGSATQILDMGPGRTEQEAEFRHVFARPGAQSLTASVESLAGEATPADNHRTEFVNVRPGRYNVVYLTNRPGPGTRFVLRSLAADERVSLKQHTALVRGFDVPETDIRRADLFIIDGAVEQPTEAALWQMVAARVRSGAGVLVLAGPDFRPGPEIRNLVPIEPGSAQAGAFTPELAADGRILPWFAQDSGVDLKAVPPFTGAMSSSAAGSVWVQARENGLPLIASGRAGRGRVVYVAGYPLWRWGFGLRRSALDSFLAGIVRFLAEADTNPFVLQPDKPGFLGAEPVHLSLKAVGPDARPWTGLDAVVRVMPRSRDAETLLPVPLVERGSGIYEATLVALPAGTYDVNARVSLDDSVVGTATAEFTVEQGSIELAHLGLNQGLLEAIAAASGARYFPHDSLPGPGFEFRLGTYERRLIFEPRRAAWAYALVALLAGLELVLRRKRGLL